MLILVTNDDGIHSPGIAALTEALSDLGRVVVVAPDRERSAVGHSLTLHSPLRAEEIRPGWFAIDGASGAKKGIILSQTNGDKGDES